MRWMLVLAAFALGGCSAFLLRAPHDPHPGQWILCSDSYTAPVVDTTVSVIGIGGGIGTWIVADDETDNDFDIKETLQKTGAVVAIIVGTAYAFGAIVGYDMVAKCRVAKRDYGARSNTQPSPVRR